MLGAKRVERLKNWICKWFVGWGFLVRSNLCEIHKNATRCSANRRLFCVFHANSTLWNGEGSMVNCGGVLSRPNLGKIYKNATWRST